MEITLYHGTSRKYLENLLQKGILPWGNLGKNNWESEMDFYGLFTPKKDCVYLGYFNEAERYAKFEEEGIVLKVKVNVNNLEADEDSSQKNWKDSLRLNGTCAYCGIISPNKIKEVINL